MVDDPKKPKGTTVTPEREAAAEAKVKAQARADAEKDRQAQEASLKEQVKLAEAITDSVRERAKLEADARRLQGEFVTGRAEMLDAQRKELDVAIALNTLYDNRNKDTEEYRDKQAEVAERLQVMGLTHEEISASIKKAAEATEDQIEAFSKMLGEQTKSVDALTESNQKIDAIANSTKKLIGGFASLTMGMNVQQPYLASMVTSFSSGEGLLGSMGDKLRGMGEGFVQVFNLSTLVASVMQGMYEQIMELVSIQAKFTKETGMGYAYAIEGIESARIAANEFSGALIATREESQAAFSALTQQLPAFTRLSQGARAELAGMTTALGQIGVDAGDAAVILNEMMSVMNIGAKEAGPVLFDLTEQMHQFGITPAEFTKNLATMLPRFAEFGKTGTKIFTDLSKKAKALNVDMESIIKVTEGFDTFEDAAPKVGQLNAIISTLTGSNKGLFNSFDLVMAVDPSERFALLTETVDQAGLSISEMANSTLPQHKFALRALAQTLGTTTGEFIKMYNENRKGTLGMVEGQKSLRDAIADAQTPSEVLQATLQDMLPLIKEFAMGFREFLGGLQSFIKDYGWAVVTGFVALSAAGSYFAYTLMQTSYAANQAAISTSRAAASMVRLMEAQIAAAATASAATPPEVNLGRAMQQAAAAAQQKAAGMNTASAAATNSVAPTRAATVSMGGLATAMGAVVAALAAFTIFKQLGSWLAGLGPQMKAVAIIAGTLAIAIAAVQIAASWGAATPGILAGWAAVAGAGAGLVYGAATAEGVPTGRGSIPGGATAAPRSVIQGNANTRRLNQAGIAAPPSVAAAGAAPQINSKEMANEIASALKPHMGGDVILDRRKIGKINRQDSQRYLGEALVS